MHSQASPKYAKVLAYKKDQKLIPEIGDKFNAHKS